MQNTADFPKRAQELAEMDHAARLVTDDLRKARLAIDQTYALLKKVDELLSCAVIRRQPGPGSL